MLPKYSCELLTIFYLYKVLCSHRLSWILGRLVVNCLQFFIFTRFFAVPTFVFRLYRKLWIAYNFLSLQGSLQCSASSFSSKDSCELLTIFYLYKVLCSRKFCGARLQKVVNCLQFFIFTRFFAVFADPSKATGQLWIAYNFLSLQGSLQ